MNWYKLANLQGIIKTYINDVPDFQSQDENYSCGNALVQNVFRILKKPIPAEDSLKRIMKTKPESGTNPDEVINYLNKNNIHFQMYNGENVEKVLKNNNIIVVEYQDYKANRDIKEIINAISSHFAILIGYDENNYYLVDSLLPKKTKSKSAIKKIPKKIFLKNWKARAYDENKIIKYWGLIINSNQ